MTVVLSGVGQSVAGGVSVRQWTVTWAGACLTPSPLTVSDTDGGDGDNTQLLRCSDTSIFTVMQCHAAGADNSEYHSI